MTKPSVNPLELGNSTSLGLLERVRAKDATAWERLISLYAPLVEHWSCRAWLQDADTADVCQDVFLAVARKLADFHRDRPEDTFRGWLRRITQRKLCDHWRKTRGGPPTAGAAEQLAWMASPAEDSSEVAIAEETQVLYRRALELIQREFEERSWQAFWRVVIDGQRPADVAADLGTTANAVYLAKGRVLARLREEFAGAIEG